MTIESRNVNELGPGKFRINAYNGEEQTCFFNRNKSDTHFASFKAKRAQADPIIFSILTNSDFLQEHKKLDFDSKNSVINGESESKLEQINKENIRNRRFFSMQPEAAESTNARIRNGDNKGRDSASARKKPRFLSN